jgi:hypothetical protein
MDAPKQKARFKKKLNVSVISNHYNQKKAVSLPHVMD